MGKASRKKQNKQSFEIKVSEALVEICNPFLPKGNLARKGDLGKLLSISVIVWNVANSPVELQKSLLDKFTESYPNMTTGLYDVLLAMISLKQKRYPNDRRIIIDYDIKGDDIQVTSIEPKEPPATVQVAM